MLDLPMSAPPPESMLGEPAVSHYSLELVDLDAVETFLLSKLSKTLEEKKIYLNGKHMDQRVRLISTTAHSASNKVFKNLKHLDWEDEQ
jgi:hypothetical protein